MVDHPVDLMLTRLDRIDEIADDMRDVKNGLTLLDVSGRQEEIARMLSGAEVTPEARAQADRLLEGV